MSDIEGQDSVRWEASDASWERPQAAPSENDIRPGEVILHLENRLRALTEWATSVTHALPSLAAKRTWTAAQQRRALLIGMGAIFVPILAMLVAFYPQLS